MAINAIWQRATKVAIHCAMIIADRLRKRLAASGLSQRALAREIGISHQAIGKIISGDTNQTPHILAIAKALQTTPAYLVGETDDPSPPITAEAHRSHAPIPSDLSAPADDNLVPVQEIDLKFGMGETILDIPVTTEVRRFDRSWLRQFTNAAPSELFFAQGIGDSMMPTLLNSDILLIDTSQKTIQMADHIWAVAMHGGGMIKRLRPWKEGVQIISDNPNVPDAMAYDGELFVIGRVVAVVRKI